MKHKVLALIIALFGFTLSGCKAKVDNVDESVVFPEVTKNVEKGNLSEIISIDDAKILGSYEDFMIGRVRKIVRFNDSSYAILSSGAPIVIYDSVDGKFTKIGDIGAGEAEYVDPLDFEIEGNVVYILTTNGIMRYGLDGQYQDIIKTDLNADGIHVFDNKIILFVLGDEHVLHLIDMKGKRLAEELPRNVALRLSRANSFYEYGDYILFHEGHSNDLCAYDRNSESFHELRIIPDEQAIGIGNEAELIESGAKLTEQDKIFFDGLTVAGKQISIGVMKDKKPFIYVSDDKNCTSISISDIEDDILYSNAMSFLSKNAISNGKFVTCIYPYILIENRDKILNSSTCPEVIKNIAEKVNENDNPIIIEYEFK